LRIELLNSKRICNSCPQSIDIIKIIDGKQFAFFWSVSAIKWDYGVDAIVEGSKLLGKHCPHIFLKALGKRKANYPSCGDGCKRKEIHVLTP